MASVPEFERKVRVFADQTQLLLNQTVCEYARVGAAIDSSGQAAVVGTNVSHGNVRSEPVALLTDASTPLWLDVSIRLTLDADEQRFLSVQSSFYGISVGEKQESVVHYDFERDKDVYTEAHIQVYGRHLPFEAYADEVKAKNRLGRYHLPVGGRRLRPCLEDVIEMLIVEKLVEAHQGWQGILDTRRKQYRKTQIEALVRRNHGTAIEELRRIGYTVFTPNDPRKRAAIARLLGRVPEPAKTKAGKTNKK